MHVEGKRKRRKRKETENEWNKTKDKYKKIVIETTATKKNQYQLKVRSHFELTKFLYTMLENQLIVVYEGTIHSKEFVIVTATL